MGAPAAGILVGALLYAGPAVHVAFQGAFVFAPWRVTLLTLPRTLAPGPLWRGLLVSGLVVGGLVTVVLQMRSRRSGEDRVVGVAALVLLAAAVVAPLHIPGWQCFSERFVPLGLALLLTQIPLERLTSAGRQTALAGALFGLSVLWIVPSFSFHRRLLDACAGALDGLEAGVQRHRIWLPVTLSTYGGLPSDPTESEVPYLAPLRHLYALYSTTMGGVSPYTSGQNSPAQFPFVLRPDGLKPPPVPDTLTYLSALDSRQFATERAPREAVENRLATMGMPYEGVVVTGARPDDVALWEQRGFVADWHPLGSSTFIAHFEPCELELEVAAAPLPQAVDLGVGSDVIRRNVPVQPDVPGAAGQARLQIRGAPCGRAWVLPHWSSPGRACANAAASGKLYATVTRAENRIDCGVLR
jgi:hypothetical protein